MEHEMIRLRTKALLEMRQDLEAKIPTEGRDAEQKLLILMSETVFSSGFEKGWLACNEVKGR